MAVIKLNRSLKLFQTDKVYMHILNLNEYSEQQSICLWKYILNDEIVC